MFIFYAISFNQENQFESIDYFCKIMQGTKRSHIQIGMQVRIVLKQDQRSGQLTDGFVKDILTRSPNHPHGIKVRLEDGQVGRVKEIISEEDEL